MLPPVEDNILQSNPEFAALYSTLTTTILYPDGSTKNDPATKQRASVRKELDEYRLKTAKQHLLTHAITTADPQSLQTKHVPAPSLSRRTRSQSRAPVPTSAKLPAELLDLLLLLPPILETPSNLDPESTALLLSSPPLSDLPAHLPRLAALVSTSLHTSAVHLARIANPSTNPSYIHRSIPFLPSHLTTLQQSLASSTQQLTLSRLSTSTSLTTLLQSQTHTVLAPLLRTLEAKHGPVARSLEFRAHETSLIAHRQQAEAEIVLGQARKEIYTPEAARALANYASHLRDAKARLAEGVRMARRELRAYGVGVESEQREGGKEGQGGGRTRDREAGAGVGKEKVMREMARVYRDMGRQVDEVRADLKRLGMA